MAFILVNISENSSWKRTSFSINDGPSIFVDRLKYVEVPAGMYVLKFTNDVKKQIWTVQATLDENDLFEAVVLVGHDGVMASPDSSVTGDLDETTIGIIRGTIADIKKREKEASKRSAKRFGFVFFSLVAIICWYMGLQKLNEDVTTGAIMVLSGAVITGVLVGLVILKIMNAIKKNK